MKPNTQKLYLKYIKDTAAARALAETESFDNRRIYAYFKKALSNYVKFRLAVMQNKGVIEVEDELIKAAIKAGIKVALAKLTNELYDNTKIDSLVDEYSPEVLNYVRNQRVAVFTKILEYSSYGIVDNE